MKKYILILIIGFISCKKQEIKPQLEREKIQSLYNFRIANLELPDTATIKVNGKCIKDPINGYHLKINKGDTVQLYYTGNKLANKGCFDFAIWEDKNSLPVIQKFQCDSINIFRKYVLGKPLYYKYYFLKTTFILN